MKKARIKIYPCFDPDGITRKPFLLGFGCLRNDFFAVVIPAALADLMGHFQPMTMRALYERFRMRLIVRKTFARSAFRLFSLGDCHVLTSLASATRRKSGRARSFPYEYK